MPDEGFVVPMHNCGDFMQYRVQPGPIVRRGSFEMPRCPAGELRLGGSGGRDAHISLRSARIITALSPAHAIIIIELEARTAREITGFVSDAARLWFFIDPRRILESNVPHLVQFDWTLLGQTCII